MKKRNDIGEFLSGIAKDIVENKIHGYSEKSIQEKINEKIKELNENQKSIKDSIVNLTKEYAPNAYQEILDAFYESHDKNVEDEKDCHVNHPNHYGGSDNPYEVIKVLENWDLDFHLGNVVKYVSRAGKKDKSKEIEDLKKAMWYLQRKIELLEK